jgi:hypothetical protein
MQSETARERGGVWEKPETSSGLERLNVKKSGVEFVLCVGAGAAPAKR